MQVRSPGLCFPLVQLSRPRSSNLAVPAAAPAKHTHIPSIHPPNIHTSSLLFLPSTVHLVSKLKPPTKPPSSRIHADRPSSYYRTRTRTASSSSTPQTDGQQHPTCTIHLKTTKSALVPLHTKYTQPDLDSGPVRANQTLSHRALSCYSLRVLSACPRRRPPSNPLRQNPRRTFDTKLAPIDPNNITHAP